MKILVCLFVFVAFSASLTAQPTAAPTTTPTTTTPTATPTTTPAPAVSSETILNGALVFTPPDHWKLDGKANDGKRARYSHVDPAGQSELIITTQEAVLTDSYAAKLGQKLTAKLHDSILAQGMKLVEGPKAEKDERFFLRIHSRYAKGAESSDQLVLYRVIGKNLVSVMTTVFTDSPDTAKPLFADAEMMLLSLRNAGQPAPGAAASAITTGSHTPTKITKPATRPTTLTQAKITFNAPAGWTEEPSDNASGIVATYHDPLEPFTTIAISVRPLPPEAKKDAKMRDALVDQIVQGEKAQFKFDGANPVGQTETIKDNRFLKKQRTRYERSDAKIEVTSRQRRIGDVVVSVVMAGLEPAATELDKLADEVAMTLRANGK